MTVPYVTFMKHAEKVTKNASAARPTLKGVYHAEGGTLAVTDSHRLYLAKNAHSNEVSSLVDPKTGANIEGNYPDVSRLIPEKAHAKFTVRMLVKESVDAFNALLKACHVNGKGGEVVEINVTDEKQLYFTINNLLMSASFTAGYIEGESGALSFSNVYMLDALNMFKAVGAVEVEMRYYGAVRPFTLTAGKDDELLALLLPIRKVGA